MIRVKLAEDDIGTSNVFLIRYSNQ
jgi:hypothetical protein